MQVDYSKIDGQWIGVDLDGTLAEWDDRTSTINLVGKPIPAMVRRVRAWLKKGIKVKIVTARAETPGQRQLIEKWLYEAGLPRLEITDRKDWRMLWLYDDRAIQVERNTGRLLGTRRLKNGSR